MTTRRACDACRRKKRWCSRELPSCAQCRNVGHQCPGYGQNTTTFVNLDLQNFKVGNKRKLRREAAEAAKTWTVSFRLHSSPLTNDNDDRNLPSNQSISREEEQSSLSTPISGNAYDIDTGSVRCNAMNGLISSSGGRQLYESLWNAFCKGYCVTREYWPRGVSQLASQNKVLDLAIMALCAKRLSFDGYPEFLTFSYDAYGRSLQLFRSQIGRLRGKANALWATVCLIFMLYEACSFRRDEPFPAKNIAFSHLNGAMALMTDCGPQAFTDPGFYEVFQKIRELVTVKAFAENKRTIFLEWRWLTVPWEGQQKSWRDLLYDVATSLTGITSEQRMHPISLKAYLKSLFALDLRIKCWQDAWLPCVSTQFAVMRANSCAQRSYICEALDMSCFDPYDIFLQAECWALQLVTDCELWSNMGTCHEVGLDISPAIETQQAEHDRMEKLADALHSTLSLPCYSPDVITPEVLTEGRCRSVLPIWALTCYRKINEE